MRIDGWFPPRTGTRRPHHLMRGLENHPANSMVEGAARFHTESAKEW
jgi:hypothetical protein